MNNPKKFLVGTHRYSFQAGKPAEILGVASVTPKGSNARACYHVRFEDESEDLIPVSESHHYEIISDEDVKAKRIPEVVH